MRSVELAGLYILLYAKKKTQIRLLDVSTCSVKAGVGNTTGNKGATIVRFQLEDTSFVFVNSHLCSGNGKVFE